MKNPTYSCQCKPSNFKLLHKNKKYPLPKKDTYYWHIANFTNDMDKYKVILAFEKVMQIWQRALDSIPPIGQFLHLKSTNNIEEADFIFSFGESGVADGKMINHTFPTSKKETKNCPFPFDGQQGILAHAWSLNTSYPFGGQMHLDESENWSEMHGFVDDKFYTHLLTVILHEMGHIFDLGHSEVKEAIMYPSYTGIKTSLHSDDLAGLSTKLSPIKKEIYKQFYSEPAVAKTKSCWLLKWIK